VPKPVVPREIANRDVDAAIAHYLSEVDERVALGFVDALERAYRHIGRHPESGSARYGAELKLPTLRSWPLKRFPYIVFYVEGMETIDVWRVLHGARDIPDWMQK
jgi:toxin ParE1/3/4